MLTWHRNEGSKVTSEEHKEMERRLNVFSDWFRQRFLSAPNVNVIAVLPIAEAKPNYRDECQSLPKAPTPGLRNTDLSPIIGAPEVAVPSKAFKLPQCAYLLTGSCSCGNPIPVKNLGER